MTTRAAATAYLKDRQAAGVISPTTAAHMRSQLYAFAEQGPDDPAKITRRDVLRWMGTLGHLAAGTRHLYVVRVRGFTTWLLRHGVIPRDPFLDVPAPKVPRAVHRTLEPEQARALLAACVEPRETVLILLALHTGLRRAELAALEVGDVSLSARTVLVRAGKGGHQRLVPLSAEAAVAVGRYVAQAGLTCGPLLRSLSDPQAGIGPGTVSRVFSEVAYRADVKVRAWDTIGPHSLRHTAASAWYEATGDVLAVRDLLGHSNLSTTARYTRGFNVERLRVAVEGRTYLDAA